MSKLLKIVGAVAPTIATAFGGPMIGLATHTLGKILLGKEDATEDELTEFILSHQNPEVLAQIKAAEIQFKQRIAELEIDLEKIQYDRARLHVDDRISARGLAKATKSKATVIIAGAVMISFATIVGMLFFIEVPTESRPVLYVLIGALATALTQVMNFYFGSSEGSKIKEEQIGAFITAAADARRQIEAQIGKPSIEVDTVETVEAVGVAPGAGL